MILVLDDHPLARQGLESVIHMCRPQEQILQAGTVREAVGHMEQSEVDMAFVDVNLRQESGFDFLEWLKEAGDPAKVIFITSSSRESDFLHAIRMGVDAYVLKDAFIDEIVYGLKVVERGGKFYSAALVERMNRVSEEERLLQELTERELEVLMLLKQGYPNARIGKELFISEGTVKKHITAILGKLGLKNRVEAVLFAGENIDLIRAAVEKTAKADVRRRAT